MLHTALAMFKYQAVKRKIQTFRELLVTCCWVLPAPKKKE